MKTFDYVIQDPVGIHARPAGQLCKVAAGYTCDISLTVKGTSVDAKRVMGVMRLGAKGGDTLTVTCNGADEDAAATALQEFLTEHL